ncbi:MAG: Asp-tRNA(Asn)/Glu-tRNA(Gln) amidotransferase subunit GatA [Bacteroidetes bacterium]|nr:MAG: Asp-tRNA(Asn)/Glu-tRNA(Gln) amidotransferase subunit GatA [Bacteroidota bacterium]MBL1143722.1 Asp-tRNA(Asn)/Glu-tRNA(Gln) amidotransferase subunit GatA [Bacteroidota bacterium]MCB0801994.1 Asp-tRNA(Asn)/Glu-tRNA(Gln) amidotransferase subunit GatA [Flavobacteriales bacterium]NOG56524.1 Asp-tRNA(Asn)/Glu-tRNA(Gln) amidotransferase subunit GatA [Bacteroidota bacterium]
MKNYQCLKEIQADIQSGQISCKTLVLNYIEKIEENSGLNIFLEVFKDEALESAQKIDQKIKAGNAGKLAGMVISLKDNICYKGHKVSASSKIIEGFESLFSATVVERLIQEDAIIIGRTNCDEFAMGSSNENSAFGIVKNPISSNKVPGGSSGGSAASVAAGMCLASLGSDTGGSIRQPASFCGNIGLKPTYGRVSRHGLIAYASSFDQIGTFANSIEDTAALLEIMSGPDEYDSTLSQKKPNSYTDDIVQEVSSKKIAYLSCYVNHEGLNPEVKEKTLAIIENLKQKGHQVDEINFDYLEQLVPAYYVLTTAEASSNLARYDGVHFGYRSPQAFDLLSTYVKSRSEGFGKEVKRRIMLGTYVLSAGYYDAYYSKAQKIRRLIKERTQEILKDYDFVLSPTTPHPAFDIGSQNEDPIKMYLEDIFTVQANLVGLPAISLPLGITKEKLPFGIQLMGSPFEEGKLLNFSQYLININ